MYICPIIYPCAPIGTSYITVFQGVAWEKLGGIIRVYHDDMPINKTKIYD